jgi:hypothetical protein
MLLAAASIAAQDDPTWRQKFEPLRIVGNMYSIK